MSIALYNLIVKLKRNNHRYTMSICISLFVRNMYSLYSRSLELSNIFSIV